MRLIEVDSKTWAVDFWWQKREKSPRKQVAELNDQLGSEEEQFYNVYVSFGQLMGVGQADNPKEAARIPSLAGAFAQAFEEQNILAFLRFDDGTAWLFAVTGGVILPQGDLFGSEDELKSRFAQYRQNSRTWTEIIETQDSEESTERIRQIREQLGRRLFTVQPVASNAFADALIPYIRAHPKRIAVGGMTLVMVLGIFYGVSWYQEYKAEQARQEQLAEKRQELQEEREDARKSLTELKRMYFPPKWREKVPQQQAVASCYREISRVPLVEQGWIVENVSCSPGQVKVTRKRSETGTFISLPSGADFQIQSPNTAIQTKEFAVSARDTERNLASRKKVSANIYEIARRQGCSVKLSWIKPESQPVKKEHEQYNSELPDEIESPYWRGEWSLKGVPRKFLREPDVLGAIPGLVVTTLKRTKDNQWNLKGEVYAFAN